MIKISRTEDDDSGFTLIVENILRNYVQNHNPKDIYSIKINHWFDFKWRAFSGKLIGAVGYWGKELRIPPFIPDRVVEQTYYEKSNSSYIKQVVSNLHIYQSSGENITTNRKLLTFSDPRIFLWFSGSTKNSLRGSIMIYQIEKEKQFSWYVSFLKKETWQIYKTDEISRNEVLRLMK